MMASATDFLRNTLVTSSLFAATGAAYAKFTNLAPLPVAKAYAIWGVAYPAIHSLVNCLTQNPAKRAFGKSVLSISATILGVKELQKMNFIGNKTIALAAIVNVLYAITLLQPAEGQSNRTRGG
jgi:hypothetical protein